MSGYQIYIRCEADEVSNEINWAPNQRSDILNRHKFLLDIDGNGWR